MSASLTNNGLTFSNNSMIKAYGESITANLLNSSKSVTFDRSTRTRTGGTPDIAGSDYNITDNWTSTEDGWYMYYSYLPSAGKYIYIYIRRILSLIIIVKP